MTLLNKSEYFLNNIKTELRSKLNDQKRKNDPDNSDPPSPNAKLARMPILSIFRLIPSVFKSIENELRTVWNDQKHPSKMSLDRMFSPFIPMAGRTAGRMAG